MESEPSPAKPPSAGRLSLDLLVAVASLVIASSSCRDSVADSTEIRCEGLCDKLIGECQTTGFGGSRSACANTCIETPASERNLSCYESSTCAEIAAGQCTPVPGGSSYDAYKFAGGPFCGLDSGDDPVECEEGDHCADQRDNECGSNLLWYDAYQYAGGVSCGRDDLGDEVDCEAGDSCDDDRDNRCGR